MNSTRALMAQRPATATSFSGLFAFRGEGQSWEKVMTFTRTGDTLKRAERRKAASPTSAAPDASWRFSALLRGWLERSP